MVTDVSVGGWATGVDCVANLFSPCRLFDGGWYIIHSYITGEDLVVLEKTRRSYGTTSCTMHHRQLDFGFWLVRFPPRLSTMHHYQCN